MKDDTFKKEKRYLLITLVLFSISYLIDVVRNAVIYSLLKLEASNSEIKVYEFFCSSNFTMSIFNMATYVITELIPYLVLFCLNL